MSSTSRTDVERRKEEAQRLRANQASMSQADAVPEEPLFEAPRKIDQTQSDHSARKIKEILGSWDKFQWGSERSTQRPPNDTKALAVSRAASPAVASSRALHSSEPPSVQPAQNLRHAHRLNGEHKKDPGSSRRGDLSEVGHAHKSKGHQGSSKPGAEDGHKSEASITTHEISGSSRYNSPHSNKSANNVNSAASATQNAKSPSDGLQGALKSKVRPSYSPQSRQVSGQHGAYRVFPDHHQNKIPASHRAKTAEPAKATEKAVAATEKAVAASHSSSTSPYHGAHRMLGLNHTSPVPCTPPSHRTPPQRQLLLEDALNQSASNLQGPTRPNLTVQIKQEKVKGEILEEIKDLDNIFKEMTDLQPPHTGIQTPIKMNVDRFPFPNLPQEINIGNKMKREDVLSTELEQAQVGPKALSKTTSFLEDLDVSEDSDEEDEKPVEVMTNAMIKKEESAGPASSNSSSDDSSSESDSSSEGGSESDSSASEPEDVPDDEEEEGEIREDTKKEIARDELLSVPSPSKENSQSGWRLARFMPTNKQSSPATRTNTENSGTKASGKGDGEKTKSSPRKIGDIGPSNTMPFTPQEDLSKPCEQGNNEPVNAQREDSYTSSNVSKTPSMLDADRSVIKHQKSFGDEKEAPSSGFKDSSPSVGPETGKPWMLASKPQCDVSSSLQNSRNKMSERTTSELQHGERKRKRTNSELCLLAKELKTEPTKSSSESEVDVESITPEPKAFAASHTSVNKLNKQLESVSKNLFGAPVGVCVGGNGSLNVPLKHKHLHRKDSIRSSKAERKSLSAPDTANAKSSMKPPNDSSSHIANIFRETTEEFKFKPLSPIESSTTPQRKEKEGDRWGQHSPLHIPTATCGKPSIVVRLPLSSLSNSCRLRNTVLSADLVASQGRTLIGRCEPRSTADSSHNAAGVNMCQGATKCVERSSQDPSEPSPVSKAAEAQVTSFPPSFTDSSPSKLPPVKRKKEPDGREAAKKQKSSNNGSSKIMGRAPSEAIENGVSHTDEPSKGSKKVPERRNSASSTSSRSSHKSSKKLKPDSSETKMKVHESEQQPKETQNLPFISYASHTPAESLPGGVGGSKAERKAEADPLLFIEDDRLEVPDFYIQKAKELKHEADKMMEKSAKLVPYVKSILYFILWGHTMEKQNNNEPSRIFTMYSDTHSLLQYVSRCRSNANRDPEVAERETKLSVLILRMQSLLCLKLYNLKKAEAMKFKQIIDHDTNKASSTMKISSHAPSPHQNSWNKNSTGTPSPMSPTPSPTCSIGSVGSQGSCEQGSCKLTNGVTGAASMSSPGMVTVPQRIHTVTQKYVTVTSYLVQCHDLWDQSVDEARPYKDFFSNLDNRCGPLSLHSSMLHLVRYVYTALKEVVG